MKKFLTNAFQKGTTLQDLRDGNLSWTYMPGEPRATEAYTVEELKKMDMIGIYRYTPDEREETA